MALRTLGRRALAALSVAILAWVGAASFPGNRLVPRAAGNDGAGAIESVGAVAATTSDRPRPSDGAPRPDGEPALSPGATALAGIHAPLTAARDGRPFPTFLSAAPMAAGLARRGPPATIPI